MTTTIDVEGVSFDLDDRWKAVKWDDHEAYRRQIAHLEGATAVDLLGLVDETDVWLVEVKDLRGHRIENRRRVSSGRLAEEIAGKIRDTLAGVLWAVGRSADATVARVASAIVGRDRRVCAVLWLEEDHSSEASASTMAAMIKSHLPIKNVKVFVTSRTLHADRPVLEGVIARSRPRR